MPHFRFALTVSGLPFGVLVTPTPTRLIALAGLPHQRQARLPRAAISTIALTAVAAAANEYRYTAAHTEIASSWSFHRRCNTDWNSTLSGDS